MSVLEQLEPATTAQPKTRLEVGYDKRLMLFSGRANPTLGAKIAKKLGVDLGPVTLKTFSNGEVYCRYESRSAAPTCSSSSPRAATRTPGIKANDALMELLVMIEAAVGASAHPRDRRRAVVRLLAPGQEVGPARADHRPPNRADARGAGVDRVLTMDLHSGQIQGFFSKPVDHMTALPMLTQYFLDQGLNDIVVVSPDAGRVKLNRNFAARSAPSWRSSTRSARPTRRPRSATSSATSRTRRPSWWTT